MQRSRFDYVKYDYTSAAWQARIKEKCQELEAIIIELEIERRQDSDSPDTRSRWAELFLNLEYTYMCAGKYMQIADDSQTELEEGRSDH